MSKTQKRLQRFDHVAFQHQLEEGLFALATNEEQEGRILRAWELTQALMEVHACVDEEDGETHEASLHRAWFDLWRCFAGERASFLYWGIYEELRYACRPHDGDPVDAMVARVGRDCSRKSPGATGSKKSKGRKKRRKPAEEPRLRATQVPFLSIVEQ